PRPHTYPLSLHDALPIFKIRQLYPVRYSGVVYEYVQPAELSSHLCHHPTDLVVASDVRLERGSFDARALDVGCEFLGRFTGFAVIDCDAADPGSGQIRNHGAADSSGAPGHQCYPSAKFHRFASLTISNPIAN